ncbi:MAG: hypothetical protein SNJ84_01050, partial [Verrucomicrobiia bacterium]
MLLVVLARGKLASEPLATRIAISPGAALRALDELGRAGWDSSRPELKSSGLSPWLAALEATTGWLPALDSRLAATPRLPDAPPLHLYFWGWDSQRAGDWKLLLAAQRQATSVTLAAPS